MWGNNGVDWMKRRTKVHSRPIHVNVPVNLLERFDQELGFKESRSKLICQLMEEHLGLPPVTLGNATLSQLIRYLVKHDAIDETLKSLLLQVLTNAS